MTHTLAIALRLIIRLLIHIALRQDNPNLYPVDQLVNEARDFLKEAPTA